MAAEPQRRGHPRCDLLEIVASMANAGIADGTQVTSAQIRGDENADWVTNRLFIQKIISRKASYYDTF